MKFAGAFIISDGKDDFVRVMVEVQYENKSYTSMLSLCTEAEGETVQLEPTGNPNRVLQLIDAAVMRHCEQYGRAQADHCAVKLKGTMREAFIKEGLIAGPRKMGNADYEVVVKRVLDEELPNSVGGLPMTNIHHYEDATQYQMVWIIVWGDQNDELEIRIEIPKAVMAMVVKGMVHTLRGRIQEKVALLKMQNPGEYEYECIDATGEEHRFDEGMTYMADGHLDPSMVWIYDRNGERGEYGMFRFKRIHREQMMVEISKSRDSGENEVGYELMNPLTLRETEPAFGPGDSYTTIKGELNVGSPTA